MPMGLRRSARQGLLRAPLPFRRQVELGVLRGYEGYLRVRERNGSEHPGLTGAVPVPPPKLRVLVAGRADVTYFLETGREQTALVRRMLERHCRRVEDMDAILDFGCGCGRLARWWTDVECPSL
ncbi:MAG: hypothetical protein ACR2NB_12520, partial [Solirubrobacteraceae bacterium]